MADENEKWLECFNNKFEELLKDLIEVFPEDKDFKMFKHSFNLLKMVDNQKPVQMFKSYGNKYRQMIHDKNEEFFLNHDFSDELQSREDVTSELMNKLKSCWQTLELTNKETIWTYFKLLFKISDKICI